MGARALRRLHPWSEPRTLRESGGARVPTFRVGARGIVGQTHRVEGALDTRRFRGEYRDARVARRDGDLERPFPYGTYAMRVHHGAPVEDAPHHDAVVTRPGPLLDDVKAELATLAREDRGRGVVAIVDDVRDAFTDEAADIIAHDDLELCTIARTAVMGGASAESDDASSSPQEREPLVVRHRFDARPKRRPSAARVVVLRDRRRGRPQASGQHGSDPPA